MNPEFKQQSETSAERPAADAAPIHNDDAPAAEISAASPPPAAPARPNFIVALMEHSNWLVRAFVIAVMIHAMLIATVASIKLVAYIPKIMSKFDDVVVPPKTDEPDDPFAAYREFDYNGATRGGGGGAGGEGPGGVPTAGGGTPQNYSASILSSQDSGEMPNAASAVIGVEDDNIGARARAAVSSPASGAGWGEKKIGTGGIGGPGGRLSARMGPMRSVNLKRFGGSEATERAVMNGLRWLKAHQESDGRWTCAKSDHAATALALLCFLGHGETPDDSKEFGLAVDKGLQFLAGCIDTEGFVPCRNMYAQGLVTLALSEGWAMTHSGLVHEPAQRAATAIVRAQSARKHNPIAVGGWRYQPDAADADVSVTGWQVMALKSAKNAGLEVPEEAFVRAAQYLLRMHGGAGFGYDKPGTTPAMTGVALLCLQFMGYANDSRVVAATNFLHSQHVDWDNGGSWSLYNWYYTTQAMFQAGGQHWIYWNGQIRDPIVRHQDPDGHWPLPPKDAEEKSHAPEPVYATTLCILTLEVYYRYLPLYQLMEGR